MTGEYSDALWPDERQTMPLRALAELSGLSEDELRQLVDCGALSSVLRGPGPAHVLRGLDHRCTYRTPSAR